MSLLDTLTGGENAAAADALKKAQGGISAIDTPTAQALSLPELQKYVNAGVMTPAQAQAVLQQGNAYNDIQTSSKPVEAEMSALSQLQDIAGAGGMDAAAKAKLAEATNATNTQEQGANGAILDSLAARGISPSLMGSALQSASNGQNAQAQSMAGEQAASDAEMRALSALSQSGTLAGNIQSQNYGEAANKAAAQNAINQWNAGNQTNVNVSNADKTQAANAYNTQTTQNVADSNTGNANYRTQYNANLPQTAFEDQLQKATGQAGVAKNQADQATNAGKQTAGLYSGLIGAGATMMGGPVAGYAAKTAFDSTQNQQGPSSGMAEGGAVPGTPEVPGDSPRNDKVHALLSPGEVVVPRSIAPHPDLAKHFIENAMRNKAPRPVHPDDVRTVLHALTSHREAA